MNENEKNISVIDMTAILKSAWRFKIIIIAVAVLFASFAGIKSVYFTDDTYTASGVVYVSNATIPENMLMESINISTIEASRTLSTTYIEVLKMPSFLMQVRDEIGGKYSWQQIRGMLSITNINETELLSIRVRSYDADDSYDIVNAIIKLAPAKLKEVCKVGSTNVADPAMKPVNADGKGTAENVMTGALIGAILAFGLIAMFAIFDKRVKSPDEVAKRYEISILGEIGE